MLSAFRGVDPLNEALKAMSECRYEVSQPPAGAACTDLFCPA
jgi:hypothetical protein